ncbi:MAG: flagellar protein FlaG [Magnetococcales bacterium]|nr:flagellar protein FlaG [Magnetococcales bacterium]
MGDIGMMESPQPLLQGYVTGTMADGTRRSGVETGTGDRRDPSTTGVTGSGSASPTGKSSGNGEPNSPSKVESEAERARLDAKIKEINKSLLGSSALQFRIDEKSQKLVVRVVDKDTDRVISQIPSEGVLALSQRMQDVEGILYDAKV